MSGGEVCARVCLFIYARGCACSCVQDKQELPWWLGVSYKGIGQYDQQDKLKPRKVGGFLSELLLYPSDLCSTQSPLGLVVLPLKVCLHLICCFTTLCVAAQVPAVLSKI